MINLNVRFVVVVWLLSLMFISFPVVAQGASPKTKEDCLDLLNHQTAALVTRDWIKLERLAKRYIKTCKGVLKPDTFSEGYRSLAIATYELDQTMASLSASEKCIEVFYANSGCHVLKVLALLKLGRMSDARAVLDITERLIFHLLENTDQELRRATHPADKKLYSSQQSELNSQKKLVDTLRSTYFR